MRKKLSAWFKSRNWRPRWQFHRKHPQFVTGNDLAIKVCKALGEPIDKVQAIVLEMKAGEVARAYVTRYLTVDATEQIINVIKGYQLIRKKEEKHDDKTAEKPEDNRVFPAGGDSAPSSN